MFHGMGVPRKVQRNLQWLKTIGAMQARLDADCPRVLGRPLEPRSRVVMVHRKKDRHVVDDRTGEFSTIVDELKRRGMPVAVLPEDASVHTQACVVREARTLVGAHG